MRNRIWSQGRAAVRLAWLGFELSLAVAHGVARGLAGRRAGAAERAAWMRQHARRILRVFNVSVTGEGQPPASGLLVCNHLSYLDIPVLCVLHPCVFVAKREVRGWPLLGACARLGGTVFVDRGSRMAVQKPSEEVQQALEQGVVVVLFPEGTSSGGDRVLPFKSALMGPAEAGNHTVTPACVRYEVEGGVVADDVCYWRDMTLVPHLVKLLGKRAVHARVSFGAPAEPGLERKELARRLHGEVARLMGVPVAG